ncbi:flavin reductase like domain-containing protein, partial [Cytidiella melzeri]
SRLNAELRNLLRDTAQPVAIVTSLMPTEPFLPPPDSAVKETSTHHSRFHGATLSSFSAIAMDPHPLIAFSLRIPSRMATTLKLAHPHPHARETPHSHPNPLANLSTHMVVNILSSHQADLAVQFSRPDLHPHPFAVAPYRLTDEGLPVLKSSLGALSCKLVASSWPLHDLESLKHGRKENSNETQPWDGEGVASELFIAQVVRVEHVEDEQYGAGEERTKTPLLYYQRKYATTRDV